ncbi:type I restriction enzyme M protein [Sphaerochaeta associata]|uniref:site-specific DNA-methyltransferase (adenine-specific) n=1 Tax=Sphaerochaeta associata TaxID=1129264 RepID=A0ABY4D6Z9_9SPIR|nr:type I restriction-modification system subunit M [Sphaerochaeta associata]UOM50073.1 type I restriction-modification system subunit M [Sphaerochaeta associata]SMP54497.1 type I restriction enzyme M protein [Sphaerochaeta associata]
MNKQQLASRIWEAANRMRSKIEAHEYKDYILGFIFYKYLSDKEMKFFINNHFKKEDIQALSEAEIDDVKFIKENVGYFISYDHLFSTWIELGSDFDVSNVRDALSAFNRNINPSHKKVFEKIFDTLQTGLSKLGDSSSSQTKAIRDLIQLIKVIPMDGRQSYDVLGFIYEYLISMFAANAGKKAGEFYTPHEVSLLMSEIVADHLKDKKEIKIYDPTSGSGSLLINIGQSVAKHIDDENSIKYYAQELKENTYNLTRMNMVMRGILPDNIVTRNGDTLEEDWPYFEDNDPLNTYNPLYVDAVVSNPPYSQAWDPSNKESDPRYARFGLAPKSKADYAFLLHDLYHLKPNGIMTIVLPHGVLFRGGEEERIRRNLIEYNHIDAIIGLPENIFFGTPIATIIMILKMTRNTDDVLIIDASKGFTKVGKKNKLRACDIKKTVDVVTERKSLPKFARLVSKEEIRLNEYNLNIPRYVDSSEASEKWDIYSLMLGGIPENEIEDLHEYWKAFPGLEEKLFIKGDGPRTLAVDDIREAVKTHPSVIKFVESFKSSFESFEDRLRNDLIDGFESVKITNEELLLSDDIFARFEGLPLVDKYDVYQLLDDEWTNIAIDLEILQTEGFEATKKADPRMVTKKEEEVQDGWRGRVIPFELVEKTLLKDESDHLHAIEDRIYEINGTYAEILDGLSEEEKESEGINEAKDSFLSSWIVKEAKKLMADKKKGYLIPEDSFEEKVLLINSLMMEEKQLKSKLKKESIALHNKTKTVIEGLSYEDARSLLEAKWIAPLLASIHSIPNAILDELVTKVRSLAEKYKTTFSEIEDDLCETEFALGSMVKELTGSNHDLKGLAEFMSLLGVE